MNKPHIRRAAGAGGWVCGRESVAGHFVWAFGATPEAAWFCWLAFERDLKRTGLYDDLFCGVVG